MINERKLTLEKASKWYFHSVNACGVINSLLQRELEWSYLGKPIVFLIDTYDIISYATSQGAFFQESHYSSVNTVLDLIFDKLDSENNLQFSLTYTTLLEIYYFCKKRADYLSDRANTLIKISERYSKADKWKSDMYKIVIGRKAFDIAEGLIERNSNRNKVFERIAQLQTKRTLKKFSRFISPDEFDYKKFLEIVNKKIDTGKAKEFLYNHRRKRRHHLALDSFSIIADVCNITLTIYLNEIQKDIMFDFVSHGVYLTLCCEDRYGIWTGEKEEEKPVKNILIALYLTYVKKTFQKEEDARENLSAVKHAFNICKKELDRNENLTNYLRLSERERKKYAKFELEGITKELSTALDYIEINCEFIHQYCIGEENKSYNYDKKKFNRYINDPKEWHADATRIKESSGEGMRKLDNFEFLDKDVINNEVMGILYPDTEEAKKMLLETNKYRK